LRDKWFADPLIQGAPSQTIASAIYGYLTREVSFEGFQKQHPEFHALDMQLSEMFQISFKKLCDDLFPFKGEDTGGWNKNKWMREHMEKLRGYDECFDILKFAAIESAPIQKLLAFGRAFRFVRTFYIENFPPSKQLGEDELLPGVIGFIILGNPPAIVSNLAFICEFCLSPRYETLFQHSLVQPLSLLRATCKYLPNWQRLAELGYIPAPDERD
jgi:hypothetical protein